MMVAGVSEIDRYKDFSKTMTKLAYIETKNESLLPNQGPTVLPLHGVGGQPIKLALRKHSIDGMERKL